MILFADAFCVIRVLQGALFFIIFSIKTFRITEQQRKDDERKNTERLQALERQRKDDEARNKQQMVEMKAQYDRLMREQREALEKGNAQQVGGGTQKVH